MDLLVGYIWGLQGMLMKYLLSAFAMLLSFAMCAQPTFPVNGTREKKVTYTAFTNAVIHQKTGVVLENATLLIQGDQIIACGSEVQIPSNTRVLDMEGNHIYPSFIDLNSAYGLPKVERAKWDPSPQMLTNKKGPFGWNQAIRPETDASSMVEHKAEEAEKLRAMGFGTVLTHLPDGISRGIGAVITLGEDENLNLISAKASAHYSFRKGSSSQDYPSSIMGSVALLRQTYYDAMWYDSAQNTGEINLSLAAFNAQQNLPQFFNCEVKQDVLRADKIGDEFNKKYIFVGSGDEYQYLDAMKETGGKFVIPLEFPDAFDVTDPYLTRLISLNEMKHWEMAPGNPAALQNADIEFALTASGMKNSKMFFDNLKKAITNGLSPERAFDALTMVPASMLGIEEQVGSLESGKMANFLITSGNLFDTENKTKIYENWVQGFSYMLADRTDPDLSGNYNFTLNKVLYPLTVEGEPGEYKVSFDLIEKTAEGADTSKVKVKMVQENNIVQMSFKMDIEKTEGTIRMTGNVHAESRIWDGQAMLPDGKWVDWVAVRQNLEEDTLGRGPKNRPAVPELGTVTHPFTAYGFKELPQDETLLIRNATIWTCEKEGILKDGDLLIHKGKIVAVGQNLTTNDYFGKIKPTVTVFDARGLHITPGIIDEHSHVVIRGGVNEGTQASSAEVSIATSLDAEDIDMYRHLAGGVTAAQLLHGSANPIGGQSAMVKFRWGLTEDELLVKGAAPFIKFALGENVKQSNWGDDQTVRFPQSRMGVEQVYYDHFILAREYGEAWNTFEEALMKTTRREQRRGELPNAPRRDLELEALWQILNQERFVTCHSYRQDEINMLIHVADSMGFTLNTFTHILEGYKVADKMKAHGAGGSSFSDWCAYKFEVKDAIPYNGAILWSQGIVTAFNSDDAEMARRLNQEAGKAVKYGGVPEEEALKFVTLNPAKLLHLDHRMGSLKVGKDADFVIWTDHPLSIYAKAKKTYIDGRCYYDADRDVTMREEINTERARLIQAMLNEGESGAPTRKPKEKVKQHYHCDTVTEENR
jgi:imidazolonepropionase-like amidohydrolase